jgi:hypothetical protein
MRLDGIPEESAADVGCVPFWNAEDKIMKPIEILELYVL